MTWHSALHWKSQLPPLLYTWLFDATSLTQRLQAQCQQQFFVEVIEEKWEKPFAEEHQLLNPATLQPMRSRHVYLHCQAQTWIFARTLIPQETLTGKYRCLENLGTQPLGEVLFQFHALQRTDIEAACLPAEHPLYQLASVHVNPKPLQLWARRSIFYLPKDKPLLVHEVFLPNMLKCLGIRLMS